MTRGPWPYGSYAIAPRSSGESHACNCIGPQNGDPVCPCRMAGHTEREIEKRSHQWIQDMLRHGKPRIRVKAGRQVI